MTTPGGQQHIVVIDGLSFLFRAFHAVRGNLTKSDGTPVNALYGFAQMLLKVVDTLNPDVCAVALDSVGRTFRKDLYGEYKAHRPPPEPEMLVQLQMFQPLVEAFGIPAIRAEGFEADDVIASIVAHYCNEDKHCRVTIVSSDKDLMQLVRESETGCTVKMLDTLKDKWFGIPEVVEKFGVGPERVIQVQALIGDSSDNVPGVKGIGPKMAAELIGQFGTLEEMYAGLGNITKERTRLMLEEHRENAFLSRQLVTLKRDVELPVGWNELAFRPRVEVAAEYLEEELEFKTLAARLRKRGATKVQYSAGSGERSAAEVLPLDVVDGPEPDDWYAGYECVQTEERWKWWLEEVKKVGLVSFDTETTGLNPYTSELVGISLAVGEGKACYVPLGHRLAGGGGEVLVAGVEGLFAVEDDVPEQVSRDIVLKDVRAMLADASIKKVAHNLKFDWQVVAKALKEIGKGGVEDARESVQQLIVNYEDTMLLSACLDAGRWGHGLDDSAARHLGHAMIKYEEVCGKGKAQVTFERVPLEAATRYAAEDADATWRLWELLRSRLDASGKVREVYEKVERPLLPILVAMEVRGVRVNVPELRALSDDFAIRMAALEKEIHALAGHPFNVNSPTQLAVVLFDELKVGSDKQKKNRSTAASILEEMAEDNVPIAELVMQYRQLAKLRGTYTEALIEQVNKTTGRVHTSYQQIGAATGRFSSTDPNLQNIPIRTEEGRKVRRAFVPQDGWVMVSADYSQIELRLLAHLSGSKALTQAFLDGVDIHAYTASLVQGVPLTEVTKAQRRAAKFVNFGLVYGMGSASLAKQIGVSKDEAAMWIAGYFRRYDGVKDYMEANKQAARDKGFVETLFGRRVWLPDIKSVNGGLRSNAERAAINAPLQGSNADIIKLAMPKVEEAVVGVGARLLLQVHDELVIEAKPEVVEELKRILPGVMGGVATLSVPLAVEVGSGPNWEEAH